MKRRRTYRRAARQRWPGSPIRGAGPWAVVSDWPTSRSGLCVSLWFSEKCARDLAYSIGLDYEYERGGIHPAPVYDMTKWTEQRQCSECNRVGHTIRGCPDRPDLRRARVGRGRV